MPRLHRLRNLLPVVVTLAIGPGTALAQSDNTPVIGAFAFGDTSEAARVAGDVERNLREFIHTTGLYRNADLAALLDRGAKLARKEAISEARSLLRQGKSDYEQLDLEKAQASFQKALRKLEFGYGYLRDPALLQECTLHLGATWVLVGEPEKAMRVFMTAHELPGPKILDPNLFPPNIQDIFNQAMQRAENAPRGAVKLITSPTGARIYLNGSYRGVSPLRIKSLRAGDHLVRAVKDGYRPWGGKIRVNAGKTRSLKMRLKPTARYKDFSGAFSRMTQEALRKDPGPAARSLAGFIDASYLAIVIIQGSPRSLTLRGYHCEVGEPLKFASHQETLDATDPSFSDKLSSYFGALLATTPEAPAETVAAAESVVPAETEAGKDTSKAEAEGEAAAAALLANPESAEEKGEDMGLNLEEKAPPAGQESATPSGEVAQASEQTPQEKPEEKTPQEENLDRSLKEAGKPEQPEEGQRPSTWGYLSSRWWFWTAVGVVAAGAATGTYFLVSSGENEGGNLIIGLH